MRRVNKTFCRMISGLIVSLSAMLCLSNAAFAQYLVRDADGGAPVILEVRSESVKLSKARNRIAESGLPKPGKDEFINGTYYSGSKKLVKFKQLEDAKGKVIIPPIYKGIWPLSNIAALVERNDGSSGIVHIPSGRFEPIPDSQHYYYTPFEGKAPAILLFGEPQPDGTYSYCFTLPDGQCGKRVDRIENRITHSNPTRTAGFSFKNNIVMNRLGKDGNRYSTSFNWNGDVLLDNAPPVIGVLAVKSRYSNQNEPDELESVLYDMGPFSFSLGEYTPHRYWPMDENGAPMTAHENFEGLFPLYLEYYKDKPSPNSRFRYVIVNEYEGARMFYLGDPGTFGRPPKPSAAYDVSHYHQMHSWTDLYFRDESNTDSPKYSIAAKRMNGNDPDIWLPLWEPGSQRQMYARLDDANRAKEGFSDPVLAIDTRLAKNTKDRQAAEDLANFRRNQYSTAIAALKARPDAMSVNDELCASARSFASKSSDPAWRQFITASQSYSRDACNYMPGTIYTAMVNAGLIVTQQGPAPSSSGGFADAMKEWNKRLDREREFNKGKTLRCYVNQGRRVCNYY